MRAAPDRPRLLGVSLSVIACSPKICARMPPTRTAEGSAGHHAVLRTMPRPPLRTVVSSAPQTSALMPTGVAVDDVEKRASARAPAAAIRAAAATRADVARATSGHRRRARSPAGSGNSPRPPWPSSRPPLPAGGIAAGLVSRAPRCGRYGATRPPGGRAALMPIEVPAPGRLAGPRGALGAGRCSRDRRPARGRIPARAAWARQRPPRHGATSAPGGHPGPAVMLTCRHTSKAPAASGAAPTGARRSSAGRPCVHPVEMPATTRVLLLCSGPIRCHSSEARRSASAAILSTPSCT